MPQSLALLRDPWRSQARFVEGRLALVFQAIERYVAAAVPERIEDVAVQTGTHWDFNAQILAAVADGQQVSVSVSVPYANVSWVPSPFFLTGRTLKATSAMRREPAP